MHEYVYEDGLLVGVRVVREPEFSDEDVAMMRAHLELEARPRNVFGTLLEEATDPANQFRWQGRDAPLVDWQVAAVGRKQDAYYEANKNMPRHGHIWVPRD